MTQKHKLQGVCSKEVSFSVADGRLKGVKFVNGCPGNLQAMARLLEGMPVGEAIAKLRGIVCGDKATSCSDQLARVLEKLLKDAQ
ncbi:MAG: TIGR03905 family TSCPD domain-containing protein [Elusimicrobiales bacterium]